MASNPVEKIKLARIAHVTYKYEDIEKAKQFAEDFGFVETAQAGNTTYYRGYGTEPFVLALEASTKTEFGGAAFAVESEEELERAARILPKEAKPTGVYEMKDAPGGGKAVTFYDPVDGFPFHLVYGQTPAEPRDPGFPTLKVNYVSGC
jgi:catechol 2,3-dioxygenase-like lactoylglutathione lyase family enzyme